MKKIIQTPAPKNLAELLNRPDTLTAIWAKLSAEECRSLWEMWRQRRRN